MDFFERQDDARKKTKLLVLYFVLALMGIIAAIYLVIAGSMVVGSQKAAQRGYQVAKVQSLWQPSIFFGTAIGVSLVVFLGSGFKSMSLNAGGSVIAKELGGRRIDPNTTDADERRVMNVVEEMAIASGVPVPEVYLMDQEEAVNAFAAGFSPSDAVIGVTRGCVKLLTRDELQGVIAHEFSHILNGDMKLNLRLIGLLFGILMLSIIGRVIMRSVYYSGGGRSRGKDNNGLPILAFGVALMIIGYIGVMFGHLIKAAISRQREYLADASAVQFTRNPDGIAGALKKIGGLSMGSRIQDPHAEEASHMFFANGIKASFLSSFATHPPLDKRIKAIDRYWDGKFTKVSMPEISSSIKASEGSRSRDPFGALSGLIAAAAANEEVKLPPVRTTASQSSGEMVHSIGEIRREQVELAQEMHASFSQEWLSAVRNQSGAQALIFALLLAQDDDLRHDELELLQKGTDSLTFETVQYFQCEIGDLHSSKKLALVDLSIPALKNMSPPEYERFTSVMTQLIESDNKVDLFEFTLQKIIQRHLDIYFNRRGSARIRFKNFAPLADDAAVLLSTLAGLGSSDMDKVEAAFKEGVKQIEMEIGGDLALLSPSECGLKRIDEALNRFDEAAPMVKRKLVQACGRIVMADDKVVSDEAELLRAIADTIGCPIPPFVRHTAA